MSAELGFICSEFLEVYEMFEVRLFLLTIFGVFILVVIAGALDFLWRKRRTG
jgi:hypothetical protein